MYCRAARWGLAAVILLAGCATQAEHAPPERIAILRFENLSGDSSVEWQGRALTELLIAQLGAISSARLHAFDRARGPRPISAPGISAERDLAIAAGATRIGYGEYTLRRGRLETRLTLEDPRTLKMVKVAEASAPSGDVLGAATALARQLSSHLAMAGTTNPEAIMLFAKAIESGDAESMERGLSQAIAADPDYARPYHTLAQVKLQRQDRAGAQAVIEQALSRKGLTAIELTRFEVEAAELAGDTGARQTALWKLAKLEPADATVWRTLAELAMARHDFREAMQACQKAVELVPDDADILNLLGYAAAQAGEPDTALAALRRYQTLRPNDANPLDSMGDVNLYAGRLSDAEGFYLQAQKKDRAFLGDADLLKAATARFLGGDSAGAGKLADQYLEARAAAKDPAVNYRRAQWTWLAGRRGEALKQMEEAAANAEKASWREGASQAWAQASLWRLALGARDVAAQQAQKAMVLATPANAGFAVVAYFASLPPAAPEEWTARAAKQFPQPALASLKNLCLLYALLANREFAAAHPLLKQIWDGGGAPPDGLQVMLAWTYLETGKTAEAAALLKGNPIPPATGLSPYAAFYLPRLFYLRGRLAEKEGRRDEARTQYRRFVELSGTDPLLWGEEAKARAAL